MFQRSRQTKLQKQVFHNSGACVGVGGVGVGGVGVGGVGAGVSGVGAGFGAGVSGVTGFGILYMFIFLWH